MLWDGRLSNPGTVMLPYMRRIVKDDRRPLGAFYGSPAEISFQNSRRNTAESSDASALSRFVETDCVGSVWCLHDIWCTVGGLSDLSSL
jgi:hypothetical protein